MAKKKKAPTKKSSSKPVLEDESLHKNIDDFLGAKKKQKEAKAEIARAEGAIISAAEKARVEHCTRTGKYESSHKVQASTGTVTVKFPNRYSKIPSGDEESLREIYDDDYDTYFREKTDVTMTEAAMNDEKFIEDMMEQLGEETFERYFEITSHIEPTKAYHEQRVTNEGLAEKHQEAVDQGLVNPTKPGLVAG
jgi:hypothetical protein